MFIELIYYCCGSIKRQTVNTACFPRWGLASFRCGECQTERVDPYEQDPRCGFASFRYSEYEAERDIRTPIWITDLAVRKRHEQEAERVAEQQRLAEEQIKKEEEKAARTASLIAYYYNLTR